MILHNFYHENGGIREFELSGIDRNKTDCQKYSAWVLGDPIPNCLCSVMCLSQETCKCSEPNG